MDARNLVTVDMQCQLETPTRTQLLRKTARFCAIPPVGSFVGTENLEVKALHFWEDGGLLVQVGPHEGSDIEEIIEDSELQEAIELLQMHGWKRDVLMSKTARVEDLVVLAGLPDSNKVLSFGRRETEHEPA